MTKPRARALPTVRRRGAGPWSRGAVVNYILDIHELNDPAAVRAAFDAYYEYLESVRESLPAAAFEFAAARWSLRPRRPPLPP